MTPADAVINIIKVDGDTTNESIEAAFKTSFLHVHTGEHTYILRRATHEGKKLDPTDDAAEIQWLLELIASDPQMKRVAEDFFNGKIHDSGTGAELGNEQASAAGAAE